MLENILIKYFNLPEDWNDNYNGEAERWYTAYDKLVALIRDLDELGVIERGDRVVDKLDKIDSEVQ